MRKTKQRETERECVRVSELKGQERVGGMERETKQRRNTQEERIQWTRKREGGRQKKKALWGWKDKGISGERKERVTDTYRQSLQLYDGVIQKISRGTITDFAATVQQAAITSKGLGHRGYFHCTQPCLLSSNHVILPEHTELNDPAAWQIWKVSWGCAWPTDIYPCIRYICWPFDDLLNLVYSDLIGNDLGSLKAYGDGKKLMGGKVLSQCVLSQNFYIYLRNFALPCKNLCAWHNMRCEEKKKTFAKNNNISLGNAINV